MYLSIWCILIFLNSALSQTKDEDRPYKFGFNIQGHQHRMEEKDEKGIIKGEYGFITADGYYRVTVYATDENGDFKIISMKNYYVGFPPEDPTTTPGPSSRDNPSIALRVLSENGPATFQRGQTPSTVTTPTSATVTTTTKRPIQLQGQIGCSNCFVPTTTKKPQVNSTKDTPSANARQRPFFGNTGFAPRPFSKTIEVTTNDLRNRQKSDQFIPKDESESPRSPNEPKRNGVDDQPRNNLKNRNEDINRNIPKRISVVDHREPLLKGIERDPIGGLPKINHNQQAIDEINRNPPDARQVIKNQRQSVPNVNRNLPKTIRQSINEGNKPTTTDAELPNGQVVNHLSNGKTVEREDFTTKARDGLPEGVTADDIKKLLYTFNYTVGFHGHHEDGYRNGDKQGDYFVDGRDGVERKVEYIANEFGYQPNITFVNLDENDVRRPDERSEKDYGLKGYEFKWFYRK